MSHRLITLKQKTQKNYFICTIMCSIKVKLLSNIHTDKKYEMNAKDLKEYIKITSSTKRQLYILNKLKIIDWNKLILNQFTKDIYKLVKNFIIKV